MAIAENPWWFEEGQSALEIPDATSNDGELSRELKDKFGLSESQCNTLMTMNDTEEKSFDYIADWIEENL